MDWKAKRDALLAEARAILDAAKAAERGMSAEETALFDSKVAEADGLASTMERDAKLGTSDVAARAKLPAHQLEPDPTQKGRTEVVERKREPGEVLGFIVRSLYTYGPRDMDKAAIEAERKYGGSSPEVRALGVSDFTAGGALVPDEFSNEIIPLLAAQSVFRKAGARVVPLRGTLEIPRMDTGASVEWVGENADRGTSEASFGSVKLIEKTMSIVTPISNDLLRLGGPSVDTLIRDQIVQAMANGEDVAFLKGAGTSYTPRGIYYQAPSAHVAATGGTTLALIRTDILNVCNLLAADNVPETKRVWIFNPRTVNYLKWSMVDSNSNFAFPDLRSANTLNGWPVYTTNNITTATNVEWYLVEMSGVFIGDGPGLEIKVMDGAAYYSSASSAVVAGLSRNQSVISALKKVDMVLAYANGVAVRHTVTI
jgi:HK97 family phage major capsid protein